MVGCEFEPDEIMSCEPRSRTTREALRDVLKTYGKDGSRKADNGIENVFMITLAVSGSDRARFVETFLKVFEVYVDTGMMPVIMPVEKTGTELNSVKISNN